MTAAQVDAADLIASRAVAPDALIGVDGGAVLDVGRRVLPGVLLRHKRGATTGTPGLSLKPVVGVQTAWSGG